jgi:hypothetical protein
VNKPVEYNNILVLFKPICGREGDKVWERFKVIMSL